MTILYLVIVGYWGIGIERCWKRLFDSRWYAWKANVGKRFESLLKSNRRSFDLQSLVSYRINLRPALALERQPVGLLPEHSVLRYRVLSRMSSRSQNLPVFPRRFLSNF